MKVIIKIIKDDYDESQVDLVASNEILENDWWRIEVDKDSYDVTGERLKEFCLAVLSVLSPK